MTATSENMAFAVRGVERRLIEALATLEAGRETQPGKLIPLARLAEKTETIVAWKGFLAQAAAQELLAGRSLAVVHALPVEAKLARFACIQKLLAADADPATAEKEQAVIRDELRARFPGSRRKHVHGTRRKLFDVDLLLIESLSWRDDRYSLEASLTAFCIDYADLRLMLNCASAPRLRLLLARLESVYPQPYVSGE